MPTAGQNERALKLFEETLVLRKAKLGPDHPDTLVSMNNLANSYHDAGQNDRALKLYEEALALVKAKLGPNHPLTLVNMNNLADSYADVGQNDRALKLFEETLALLKAKLGPRPPLHARILEDRPNAWRIPGSSTAPARYSTRSSRCVARPRVTPTPRRSRSRIVRAELDLARGRLDAAEAANRAILDECRAQLGADDRAHDRRRPRPGPSA